MAPGAKKTSAVGRMVRRSSVRSVVSKTYSLVPIGPSCERRAEAHTEEPITSRSHTMFAFEE